ncbi:hypothetical protein FGIG_02686 [Fasciola gigantica]|uniref:Intimal thickness related receptor IRP domain-containing protein n=1 Tax=Fasciola gigantica TaxID=46835 RepID=A0A504YDV0_FASGI|nr:hypothetical protein FGIG_02686 [Fasciola gigantica]
MIQWLSALAILRIVMGFKTKFFKLDDSVAQYMISYEYQGYDGYTFLIYRSMQYNCTGYFDRLDRDRAVFVLHEKLRPACGYQKTVSVANFKLENNVCHFLLKYEPNRETVETDNVCNATIGKLLKNLPEVIWGSQWGCPTKYIDIHVNSYYTYKTVFFETAAAGLSQSTVTYCDIPILQIKRKSMAKCQMNSFGGYNWVTAKEGICGRRILDPPTMGTINILRKSQIFCQLAVFLIYGLIKTAQENVLHQISLGLEVLQTQCVRFAPWEFAVARLDYFKLMDLILYRIAWLKEIAESGKIKKRQWDIFPLIHVVLHDVVTRISDYFPLTINVFLRSQYIYAHQHVVEPTDTVWKPCGGQFAVKLPNFNGPVLVSCIHRMGNLQLLQHNHRLLATGYVLVEFPEAEESSYEAPVHIAFGLPSFLNGLPYDCAELMETEPPKSFRPSSRCRLEVLDESIVGCICKGPGAYALIQSVGDMAFLRPYFFNHLAVHSWTRYIHEALIVLLIGALIFLLTIRCSRKLYTAYQTRSRSSRRIYWVDLAITILFLEVARLILQISSINMQNYQYCNMVGLATLVITFTVSVAHLACAIVAFALVRTASPGILMIQLGCFIYASLVASTICYYMFTWGRYMRINCLPEDHLKMMVIPMLTVNIFTLIALSIYWFLRPYHYMFHWFGVLLDTVLGMIVWITLILSPAPEFYLTKPYERLVFVTLWQALFSLCFHCLLEPGIIRTICYLCSCRCVKRVDSVTTRKSAMLLPKLIAFRQKHSGIRAQIQRIKSQVAPKFLVRHSYRPSEVLASVERRRGYFEKVRS